jgi:hypothetical protein
MSSELPLITDIPLHKYPTALANKLTYRRRTAAGLANLKTSNFEFLDKVLYRARHLV